MRSFAASLRRTPAFLLLHLIVSAAHAQSVNTTKFSVVRTGNGGPIAAILPTAGGWLVPGTIQFSNDSNCISLLRFSPTLTITRSRQYRVANSAWNTNLGPFVPTPYGLIGRGQSNTVDGLFSFDSTFALRWAMAVPFGLSRLVTQGRNLVVGYQIRSTTSGTGNFTRVWCSARTGTNWRGRRLNSTQSGWRVTTAYAPDTTGTHYLGGDVGAPLIKLDTTKVYWSYLLSAGGTSLRIGTPAAATNGELLVPMQNIPATGQPSEIIICRFDTAGTLLWNRRLALPNRYLGISDLHELPGGDLLLAGYARVGGGGKFQPMIFRLTAAGTLVWAHRWDVGTTGPLGGTPSIMALPNGSFRLFNSDLSFIDLDANFNGCQFVDETANITVGTATITRTPLPLTMTTIAVTAAPAALINRSFTYTSAPVCTAVGVAEDAAEPAQVVVWPQPLPPGSALHLTLPSAWPAATVRLTLTSLTGQVVWRGTGATPLLPPTLPAGCWLLTATNADGQRVSRRILTE